MPIDLNADLGEGMGDDDALLTIVSSANLACGGHAGDDATMRRLCAMAAERGVRIGAHVSYVDREGFGRRRIDVKGQTLTAQIAEQIDALDDAARSAGIEVSYVKPHGALYNTAADDPIIAAVVVQAVTGRGAALAIMGLPGCEMLARARAAGLSTISEAFADRAYDSSGRLVDRSVVGAVHHDVEKVVAQALSLAAHQVVTAIDGSTIAIEADSLCLHGDSPDAVLTAAAVRDALVGHGIEIARWR